MTGRLQDRIRKGRGTIAGSMWRTATEGRWKEEFAGLIEGREALEPLKSARPAGGPGHA